MPRSVDRESFSRVCWPEPQASTRLRSLPINYSKALSAGVKETCVRVFAAGGFSGELISFRLSMLNNEEVIVY